MSVINKTYSIAPVGMDGALVEIETNLSRHLPRVIIVGLADTSVQEAKERVWAAIENSGYAFPRQKVVVNLAPAQMRKEGGSYDLPIAISILQASGDIKELEDKVAFIGELSLRGDLKSVPGVLVMVSSLKQIGFKKVYLPRQNAREASIIDGIEVLAADNLQMIVDDIGGKRKIVSQPRLKFNTTSAKGQADFSEIRGQAEAKRVLEIAAAGGHNVLMIGPPGSGKTLLAKSFLSILPDIRLSESLETSKVYSLAGLLNEKESLVSSRILRNPHHSASVSAIVGGGSWPRPGEISLAHNNVLFLDEILEFPKKVLEALRQPLEDKVITVSRARGSFDFPANFILLATANPCPCGYLNENSNRCNCSPHDIKRYQKRLSGPILDRIDLHLFVDKVSNKDLMNTFANTEASLSIKKRVTKARGQQDKRFGSDSFKLSADMTHDDIKRNCRLSDSGNRILDKATSKLDLSARAYFKMLKVARTIADLAGSRRIRDEHLLEALQYRNKIVSF